MKEKKEYTRAKAELIFLEEADIITSSGSLDEENNYDPGAWV